MQFTIKQERSGYAVIDSQGTKVTFSKLWLALSYIEKQFKA